MFWPSNFEGGGLDMNFREKEYSNFWEDML
jgi:hypothetical protein